MKEYFLRWVPSGLFVVLAVVLHLLVNEKVAAARSFGWITMFQVVPALFYGVIALSLLVWRRGRIIRLARYGLDPGSVGLSAVAFGIGLAITWTSVPAAIYLLLPRLADGQSDAVTIYGGGVSVVLLGLFAALLSQQTLLANLRRIAPLLPPKDRALNK